MTDNEILPVPIDRTARDQAVVVLRRFLDGEISNREFEKTYPESKDPALYEIWIAAWGVYDDIYEHRLIKRHALSAKDRIVFERCIIFLHTNNPWPYIVVIIPWWRIALAILLLPLIILFWLPIQIYNWWRSRHPHPEEAFWPFQTEKAYQETLTWYREK